MKESKVKFMLLLIFALALVIRLIHLDTVPPSLFTDEVDTGYQGYSLVKTGRDYFGNLWPIHFQSFGDWRVPLYIYLDAPVVGLFGLSAWTVRLPAAIIGALAVLVVYLLVKELFKQTSNLPALGEAKPRAGKPQTLNGAPTPEVIPGLEFGIWKLEIAELAALLLAISPWHLHFSRGAFEAILVTLLFPLGFFFLKKGLEDGRLRSWVFAALSLGLTPYAYNTPKLFLPLSLVLFTGIFFRNILSRRRQFLVFLAVLALVLLPQAKDLIFGPSAARFQTISLFADPEIAEKVRFSRESGGRSVLLENALHNKATFWFREFAGNYLRAFSPEFLFLSGDPNPRHSLPGRGQLYLPELPFLLAGLFFLFRTWGKNRHPWTLFIIGWFLIAPVPAALTQGGGSHAIRLIHFLPVVQLIVAFGFVSAVKAIRSSAARKILITGSAFLIAGSFFLYLHTYYIHYPKITAGWWNYGYREVFDYLIKNEDRFSKIYLSSSREPSLVHAFFHGRFSPKLVQAGLKETTEAVGRYHFLSPNITELGRSGAEPATLYILNTGELANLNLTIDNNPRFCKIKDVVSPDGERLKIIFAHADFCQ